jgi:hypothetical protein
MDVFLDCNCVTWQYFPKVMVDVQVICLFNGRNRCKIEEVSENTRSLLKSSIALKVKIRGKIGR